MNARVFISEPLQLHFITESITHQISTSLGRAGVSDLNVHRMAA